MGAAYSRGTFIQVKHIPAVPIDPEIELKPRDLAPFQPPEYAYIAKRLASIDWRKMQTDDLEWSDPYFRAGEGIIVDPMMMRSKRVSNWTNFAWRRPSEIYTSVKMKRRPYENKLYLPKSSKINETRS